MVVTVPLVRMVQVSFHKIIRVAAVRNRLMPAVCPMRVFPFMCSAAVIRSTSGWIGTTLTQSMFIHMSLMGAMKMSVVQIIDVTFVIDCSVAATGTMRMGVLIVRFVIAHLRTSPCDREVQARTM
jgi:hypothetical protein